MTVLAQALQNKLKHTGTVDWSSLPIQVPAWIPEEYTKALTALRKVIKTPNKNEYILKNKLRHFLNLYWQAIGNSIADYFHFPSSPLNQICVFIVEQIAAPNEAMICILVPTLTPDTRYYDEYFSATSLGALTEITGHSERKLQSLSLFNLSDDQTKLVPIVSCLTQAQRSISQSFEPLYLHQYVDCVIPEKQDHRAIALSAAQAQIPLSNIERKELMRTASAYCAALNELEGNDTGTAYTSRFSPGAQLTLWDELQLLLDGLKEGGAEKGEDDNIDPKRAAKWAIKRFHHIWSTSQINEEAKRHVLSYSNNRDIVITQESLTACLPLPSSSYSMARPVSLIPGNPPYYVYVDNNLALDAEDGTRVITLLLEKTAHNSAYRTILPQTTKLTLQHCLAQLFVGYSLLPVGRQDWQEKAQNMTAGGHTCILVIKQYIENIIKSCETDLRSISVIALPIMTEHDRAKAQTEKFARLERELIASLNQEQKYSSDKALIAAPDPTQKQLHQNRYLTLEHDGIIYPENLMALLEKFPDELGKKLVCELVGWKKIAGMLFDYASKRIFFHHIKTCPLVFSSMCQDLDGFKFVLACKENNTYILEKFPCYIDLLDIYHERWAYTLTPRDLSVDNQTPLFNHIETVFAEINSLFGRVYHGQVFTHADIPTDVIAACRNEKNTAQQLLEYLTQHLATLYAVPKPTTSYQLQTPPKPLSDTSMRLIHSILLLGHHIHKIPVTAAPRPRLFLF